MPPQSALLRQPYLLHEVCEPRVRAQWAERKVSLQTLHLEFPLAVCGIEPDECLVFVAKLGVENGNFEWRCIAALALLEAGLDAFLHRRFPASRLKTFRQRIRELRLGGAAQVLGIKFPLFQNFGVVTLRPVGAEQAPVRTGIGRIVLNDFAARGDRLVGKTRRNLWVAAVKQNARTA